MADEVENVFARAIDGDREVLPRVSVGGSARE
jgi:hypothetical protein